MGCCSSHSVRKTPPPSPCDEQSQWRKELEETLKNRELKEIKQREAAEWYARSFILPWNSEPHAVATPTTVLPSCDKQSIVMDDKQVDGFRDALRQHVQALDELVVNKKHQTTAIPLSGGGVDYTSPHRIGDGLGNQNVMIQNRQDLMDTDHQLYWTQEDSKTWDMWAWLMSLCDSANNPLLTQRNNDGTTTPLFHLYDLHCGYGDTQDHVRRNSDKPSDPHVCCIWHGYKTVVERLTDPTYSHGADALKNILRCSRVEEMKLWPMEDLVQGVFATFVYTFEVKKLPQDQTDGRGSGTWPSHYGFVNAKLREHFNPLIPPTQQERAVLQQQYKTLLSPFVVTLQNFLLECLPAVGTLLTFRGIDMLVARYYTVNEYFIWPAFSSTSTNAEVAMSFGNVRNKQGSFFQLQVSSGRDISQFSMFPSEAEVLLPANTAFQVGYRMSDTLLTLTNFSSDIVTCAEIGSGAVATEISTIVQQRLEALRAAKYLYKNVFDMYVTPRVGLIDNAVEDELKTLIFFDDELPDVASEQTKAPNAGNKTYDLYVILADGGMGKTMTTVRLVYDVICGYDEKRHEYTPVFVSLPQLLQYETNQRSGSLKYSSLCEYILDHLVLPDRCKDVLIEQRLIVFLDSLDEVSVDLQETTQNNTKSLFDVLSLGEFRNAIFVMTSRREIFPRRIKFEGLHPDAYNKIQRLYLRPPSQKQMKQIIKQVYRKETTENGDPEESLTDRVLSSSVAMSTPLLCTLSVEALLDLGTSTPFTLDLYTIYHHALHHHYRTKGIRKVWNSAVYQQIQNVMKSLSVQDAKDALAQCALQFGALLAVYTFLENTWPVDIDVERYRKNTKWSHVVQLLSPETETESINLLLKFLRAGEETGDGSTLIRTLFDMQPLRAESMESGVWCYRHKTIHEHLIAMGLLNDDADHLGGILYSIRNTNTFAPHTVKQLRSIPRQHPGIMDHCFEWIQRRPKDDQMKLTSHLIQHKQSIAASVCASLLVRMNRTALSHLDLQGCNLEESNLYGAVIHDANLQDASLQGSLLHSVHFSGNTMMDGCKLSGCSLGVLSTLNLRKKYDTYASSVCISRDGKKLITASGKFVKVWDTATMQEIATLAGHTQGVTCVHISPDGTKIVSGSYDLTAKVWDAVQFTERASYHQYDFPINAVWIHSIWITDTKIVSADQHSIRVINIDGVYSKDTQIGDRERCTCVCISPDDTKIISGSMEQYKMLKVWDTTNNFLPTWQQQSSHDVNCVCVSDDSTKIISGSVYGSVTIWDAATLKDLATFTGRHLGPVNSICIFRDGTKIVTGSKDKTVKIWDVATLKEVATLSGHLYEVHSVGISDDGSTIVSGCSDIVILWDATTLKEVGSQVGHTAPVTSICLSNDGSTIVSGSEDNTVKIWDAGSMKEVATLSGFTGWDPSAVTSVCISADGTKILSAHGNAEVKVWNSETFTEIGSLKCCNIGSGSWQTRVCISDDGTEIVAGVHQTVKVWDAQTLKEVAVRNVHSFQTYVEGVCISPDNRKIISVEGNAVNILMNGKSDLYYMKWFSLKSCCKVVSVCFSHDGTKIITGGTDATVTMWDADTLEEIGTLSGHTKAVTAVCISKDGTRILSSSQDKSVKIWDAKKLVLLATQSGHTSTVTSVCITDDGTKVMTASKDNTIKTWVVEPDGQLRLSRVCGPSHPIMISSTVSRRYIICDDVMQRLLDDLTVEEEEEEARRIIRKEQKIK